MADRRMLWKNVCRSRKVNLLSDRAALLWTWAIPWFDRDGYLEVESDFITETIFPKKKITEEDAKTLIYEIFASNLWLPFIHRTGKLIAKDPRFREFQTNQYDREGKSDLKDTSSPITLDELAEYSPTTRHKIREEKLREVKLIKESSASKTDPPVDNSKAEKAPAITEDQKKQLKKLSNIAQSKYRDQKFNPYQWLQVHIKLKANPNALIHTLESLNKNSALDPWAYCEKTLSIEEGNHNEHEHTQNTQKIKTDFNQLVESIKLLQDAQNAQNKNL